MRRRDDEQSPLTEEERAAALRALFVHVRLALDDLERVLTGTTGPRGQTGLGLGEREVMKPGEYADRMRVSVRRVHGWVARGMPHFTIEGRVRIRVAEADDWVRSLGGAPPPVTPPHSDAPRTRPVALPSRR